MKKMKKRFLTMGVCLAVLFCSLVAAQPVNAATKTVTVTVRYRGKDVVFEKNLWGRGFRREGVPKGRRGGSMGVKTYAAVKKAWGKANKVQKYGDYCNYAWQSGKTSISFLTDKNGKRMGDLVIDIQDKKATLCGIQVGMSKKQALQKLRKWFGKKNVLTRKNWILANSGGPYDAIIFNLKSGKISSIYFGHS